MKKETEICQIEYLVNDKWIPTEYKMPLSHAEAVILESEWRPLLETRETCKPGQQLVVPVLRGAVLHWSEQDLSEFRDLDPYLDPAAEDGR